jgi:hypothetical protein
MSPNDIVRKTQEQSKAQMSSPALPEDRESSPPLSSDSHSPDGQPRTDYLLSLADTALHEPKEGRKK